MIMESVPEPVPANESTTNRLNEEASIMNSTFSEAFDGNHGEGLDLLLDGEPMNDLIDSLAVSETIDIEVVTEIELQTDEIVALTNETSQTNETHNGDETQINLETHIQNEPPSITSHDALDSQPVSQSNDVGEVSGIESQTNETLPLTIETNQANGNPNRNERQIKTKAQNQNRTLPKHGNAANSSDREKSELCCPECSKCFVHKVLLKRHIVNHHPALRPWCCSMCPKSFPTNAGLKQHLATHQKSTVFTCYDCFAQFKQKGGLTNHKRRCPVATATNTPEGSSGQTGDYSQVFQQFIIQPQRLSAKEKYSLSAGKPFKCPLCKSSFQGKHLLGKHMYRHSEDLNYKCKVENCGKIFKSRKELNEHQFVHNKEAGKKCPECEKFFRSTYALKRHRIIYHTREFPIYCDICQKGFVSSGEFKRHETLHFDPPGEMTKPCACSHDICVRCFRTPSEMKKHVQRDHSKQYVQRDHSKQFRNSKHCDICDKNYTDNRALMKHTRSKHPTEAQKQARTCVVCKKDCRGVKGLARHMKAYHLKCGFCGKECKGNWGLRKHLEANCTDKNSEPCPCIQCKEINNKSSSCKFNKHFLNMVKEGHIQSLNKDREVQEVTTHNPTIISAPENGSDLDAMKGMVIILLFFSTIFLRAP